MLTLSVIVSFYRSLLPLSKACDNVFKVCREKRGNGGKCGRDAGCQSGYCVSGYCRECPTAGSSTGCPTGEFCQRLDGIQTHVCRPKKDNGSDCAGNDACDSGHCVTGFCRECPTANSYSGCPSGEFCQRTYGLQTHVCRPPKDNEALVLLQLHARAVIVYQDSAANAQQPVARLRVQVENSVSKYISPMFI